MNLREDVMEQRHLRAMEAADAVMPRNAVFLELICSKPKSGSATFLMLSLLSKLAQQKDAIVCNPTNEKAWSLSIGTDMTNSCISRNDLAILDRNTAADFEENYLAMRPGLESTIKLCTRGGVRDTTKTDWDAAVAYYSPGRKHYFTFGPSGYLVDVGVGSWGARYS